MHVARVSREHVYHDACLKIQQVHVIVSQPRPIPITTTNFSHCAVLVLARCVKNVQQTRLPVNDHLLSLAVLDGGVILVNKMRFLIQGVSQSIVWIIFKAKSSCSLKLKSLKQNTKLNNYRKLKKILKVLSEAFVCASEE